ncbi:MAG: hypothetical protein IJV35_03225 [Neisseriaceae bacterium]|nr:hypothetical protein [Neisseriaceae bacterium]
MISGSLKRLIDLIDKGIATIFLTKKSRNDGSFFRQPETEFFIKKP